jgi:HEAT repeat protein
MIARASTRLASLALLFLSLHVVTTAQSPAPDIAVAPAVLTRLQNQINQGSVEEKRSALFEIRNLRAESASRIAVPALRDQDAMVRATAAGSVIFLSKAEGTAALLPLLNDKSEFVRTEAAYALGKVGDRSATGGLVRLMKSDKILEVRTAAAVGLGGIGDISAIESLTAVLKSRPKEEDEFLRRSAARSIGQIAQINVTGDPAVLTPQNFLPNKFKDLGSSDATGPVPQIYSDAVDVLTTVLRNKNETDDTRREAAFSLGAIGDSRSLDVLRSYLSGPDPYLAEICKEAVLKIERRNKLAGNSD